MKKNYLARLFTFLLLLPVMGWGQTAGSLDRSFNYGRWENYQFNYGNGASSTVNCSAVQSDGKILIGGWFTSYNGASRGRIARLNADGSLDNTFNLGTGANSPVTSITLQLDGKIIIGGGFSSFNGTARNYIARLNADGSLDYTFDVGSGANSGVLSTTLQPDGKIIIGGDFTTYNGIARKYIARLNSDGSLDNTFEPVEGPNGQDIRSISLQPDGKIIIGGYFSSFNGIDRRNIARLNANGSLDETFNPGLGAFSYSSIVSSTSLQSDGKIIIGGEFGFYNGVTRNRIARLNSDGSLDNNFNSTIGANLQVKSSVLQSNGKIIVGGTFTTYNGTIVNRIARINTDGSLDISFNPGAGANSSINSTILQQNGKIIICGDFYAYAGIDRRYIARLNVDGSLDNTFNLGTGANIEVRSTALQSDGKIIIGGLFTSYNGRMRNGIARLDASGGLDTSFYPGAGIAGYIGYSYTEVLTSLIQVNGKIIIGGNFTSYDGNPRKFIARLNSNGSLDNTFTGEGANSHVYSTALQPDGKIIIGGNFTIFNRNARNRIARLNTDGSLDNNFNFRTGANNDVCSIYLQPDSKIIIGGRFTSYSGTNRNRIARLNSNGNLDTSFNPGTGANDIINSISLQQDGKIIIGGLFTSYNGIAKNHIARLNSDGSLDNTFNLGTGANSEIRSTALQSDGKIIIGGWFTSYNGTSINHIARLNFDGSLDNTFTGEGANNYVNSITLQPDDKILIGGYFTGYNSMSTPYIARIHGGGGCIVPSTPTISGTSTFCFGNSTVLTSSASSDNLWSNGATTQSITVSTAGSYTVRVVSGSCTSATSNTFIVSVENCGDIFTGTGNYNIASNWANNQVPAAGSNITVLGNMTVNSNISYGNISVRAGGIINITNSNTLTVTGNLTNQGIISGEGTIRLAGTNNQNFGGGTITNLFVNNSATVIQSAATQISGSLTLGITQVLNLNNNALSLLSTATHTAQLAQVPSSSSIINANNFTVQRWLNSSLVRRGATSNGNFYFLGPVLQGQTMNLWNSVSPYNNQTFSGIGVGNLYLYNPAVNNWYKPSSATTPLSVGAGVQVWFGASTFFGSRSTWSVTGTPQVGNYNLPITANQGFQLLSNPYPSTIDWDSPNWTKTNVSNAIYVYDWVNRRYKSYIDGIGSNGGTRYLPTAQGFIVYSENTSPVLTAREGIKVTNQVALQRTESQVSSLVRMQVRRGSMIDEVVIAHRPNTQLAFEPQVDAIKMINPATNIFVGGAVRQSIASMDLNAATVIPIELLSDSTGMVTLSTTEFSGLSGGTYYLVDEVTTEVYPFTPESTYQFYLNANEPYSLSLRMNNVTGINNFKAAAFEVFPNPATDKVTIKTTGTGTLEILNTLGQVMITQPAAETNEINLAKLAKGVYTVRFNGGSKILVVK